MKRLCVVITLLCFLLCGCSEKVDPDEFLDASTKLLETNNVESFSYESTTVTDEDSKDFVYNYKSDLRDLSFYVETYLDESKNRIYYTSYYDSIKAVYLDTVTKYIAESELQYNADNSEIVLVLDDAYMETLKKVIEHCNLLYVIENQYHDDERFTEAHTLLTLHIVTEDGKLVIDETIDGFRTADSFYDDLCEMYEYHIIEGNE